MQVALANLGCLGSLGLTLGKGAQPKSSLEEVESKSCH